MLKSRSLGPLAAVVALVLIPVQAGAEPRSAAPAVPSAESDIGVSAAPAPAPSVVSADRRDEVLGKDWSRSKDRIWTTAGDADGLHVLVADAASGYSWRTAATLSEAGFEVDQWIGNACVTGSGQRLVVVYAPRTFTNEEELFARGGFAAVVDLESGAVTKLPVQTSLAYFNPGCGVDESAVFTQEGGGELTKTRVLRVDAATGTLAAPIEVPGQLTSAVPVKDGIVAADSHSLVRLAADGTRRLFAPSTGVPFEVTPDAEGGVVFLDKFSGKDIAVRRATAGSLVTLAAGPLTKVDLARGAAGKVFITGAPDSVSAMPSTVTRLDVVAKAEVSTLGQVSVTSVRRAGRPDPRAAVGDPTAAQPVQLDVKVLATGRSVPFTVDPAAALAPKADSGRAAHPSLTRGGSPATAAAGSPTDPVDADGFCSVPRNDVRNQALQPKPRQVEWAVDQAVRGVLTVQRPVNWKNLGMPAYTPQGLFPRPGLVGGGYIPAQIMLGIVAQESNLWQASRAALPGVTANPLIGNFYGRAIYDNDPGDDWTINWNEADCGYGVAQVTDGMRLAGHAKRGEVLFPYQTQRAVAVDFAANVAAGVQILEKKWNEVRQAGMSLHDGDPQYLENWFFAVWAYNSGFHPNAGSSAPWGVGWGNNPINPHYDPNRAPFLETSYDDARHPQDWPYPEKVIGWAGHPIESVESPGNLVGGYRWAWWPTEGERFDAKPPADLFCNSSIDCYPGTVTPEPPSYPGDPDTGEGDVRGEPAGPCAHRAGTGEYDLRCWYHQSTEWQGISCANTCGNETLRFDPGYPYQEDGNSYPPNCTMAGIPNGALIIDDTPDFVPIVRGGCTNAPWRNAGSFGLDFAGANGLYNSKVDFHQIGGGFRGHFWFAHTRQLSDSTMRVTGTWTLNQSLNSWARVLVHLPDHGAWTQQAKYDIDLGNGKVTPRYLNQGREANNWVSLGVYPFAGVPKVSLSTVNEDGRGDDDIAWDAVAFQPLPGKPRHIVAALGDSYTSGEGAGEYLRESDNSHGTPEWNACRRSQQSWPRKMRVPGIDETPLGIRQDRHDPTVELSVVACSGAKTSNVNGSGWEWWWDSPGDYDAGQGQFHEISQVKSGVLTDWTTLVVLTVGGNDEAAFGKAVTECAGFSDCSVDPEFLPKYRAMIDRIQLNINTTITRIHNGAKNAQIVLIGYPELFSRTRRCAGPPTISLNESAALGALAAYMGNAQNNTVTNLRNDANIRVDFANPIPSFSGHSACDSAEWINALSLGPNGDGDYHYGDKPTQFCFWEILGGRCASRHSFHPNQAGTDGYARVIEQKLLDIHYGS